MVTSASSDKLLLYCPKYINDKFNKIDECVFIGFD